MNTLEKDSERFVTLPLDFQEALKHFDYDKRLSDIHVKYKLHIDQSFALEKALADIVFGARKSAELIGLLKDGLHTTHAQAEEISHEINDTILIPIREAIMAVQERLKNKVSDEENDII